MPQCLNDRAIIAVSGPDAGDFLQSLVTNDIQGVDAATPRYAALLTPQGKILFDFLIFKRDNVFLLDCAASASEALVKQLSLYRLRSKVEIKFRDDLVVVWDRNGNMGAPFVRDPRHPQLGSRAVMSRDDATLGNGSDEYAALRFACGVPEGLDFGKDKVFALDADLGELGGVSFEKGCYVGQELTARMKHRGTARKRLLAIHADNGIDLPDIGTPITADGRELGMLNSVSGSRGFALIRFDRLQEAAASLLRAADVDVHVLKPEWLFT